MYALFLRFSRVHILASWRKKLQKSIESPETDQRSYFMALPSQTRCAVDRVDSAGRSTESLSMGRRRAGVGVGARLRKGGPPCRSKVEDLSDSLSYHTDPGHDFQSHFFFYILFPGVPYVTTFVLPSECHMRTPVRTGRLRIREHVKKPGRFHRREVNRGKEETP